MQFAAAFLLACASLSSALSAQTPREQLSAAELSGAGSPPSQLIEGRWFLPPETGALLAHEPFSGTLLVEETTMATDIPFASHDVLGKDPQFFPGAELQFFTEAGDLVPVDRDVIRIGSAEGGRSYWDVLLQPGRVWSEAEDGGWSRASFPFALVHSIEGETHNGVATFLYRGGEVSDLIFQIVQQTAPYNVPEYFKAWGRAEASFRPGNVDEGARERYAAELKDKLPIAPWADLETKVGADKLAGFASSMDPGDVIVSGLVYDGVLYRTPCASAAGPLPYCDRTRFGVWSVSKAASNAVALFRLAQKFGPEVLEERIADHVAIPAGAKGWEAVTFLDALNMATGVGFGSHDRSAAIDSGYLEGNYADWYVAPSVEAKLAETFKSPDLPWEPGEVARYRDQDMFLLGVAMRNYLRSKQGQDADLWRMVTEEVYRPIGIHHAPTNRTIEAEGQPAHALMAYGFYPTLEDLAKIAQLFHDGGVADGQQLLYRPLIEQVFTREEPGLPAGEATPAGPVRYQLAFWERPFAQDGCRLYIPRMSGWGGNLVVLMPGGMTGIRLARDWDGEPAADDTDGMHRVADRLTPFCS
jgi:hypothetical protein